MTCPFCGWRDVVDAEEESCAECVRPVRPRPLMTMEMRVYRYLARNPESSIEEVGDGLEVAEFDRNPLSAMIYRMVRDGSLRAEGYNVGRRYFAADERKVRAGWGRLSKEAA